MRRAPAAEVATVAPSAASAKRVRRFSYGNKSELDATFAIFDMDGSGCVNLREFVAGMALRSMGVLSRAQKLRLLFNHFDWSSSVPHAARGATERPTCSANRRHSDRSTVQALRGSPTKPPPNQPVRPWPKKRLLNPPAPALVPVPHPSLQ